MTTLTILYTAGIRGDLALLPRLYTFIMTLRRELEPAAGRTLLLDLGDSCAPEVWHCQVTGGRSALIALDALGCHAARVPLDDETRARLSANLLGLILVDERHPWHDDRLAITAQNTAADDSARLHIVLSPAEHTQLNGTALLLAGVRAGEVGWAQVELGEAPHLRDCGTRTLPPGTLPAPTIAAAVDFILAEARQAQRKRDS